MQIGPNQQCPFIKSKTLGECYRYHAEYHAVTKQTWFFTYVKKHKIQNSIPFLVFIESILHDSLITFL